MILGVVFSDLLRISLVLNETCKVLGIAKSSLHRYLSGERKIPNDVIKKALKLMSKQDFESIVNEWDKLRALGVISDKGIVDYGLALKYLL